MLYPKTISSEVASLFKKEMRKPGEFFQPLVQHAKDLNLRYKEHEPAAIKYYIRNKEFEYGNQKYVISDYRNLFEKTGIEISPLYDSTKDPIKFRDGSFLKHWDYSFELPTPHNPTPFHTRDISFNALGQSMPLQEFESEVHKITKNATPVKDVKEFLAETTHKIAYMDKKSLKISQKYEAMLLDIAETEKLSFASKSLKLSGALLLAAGIGYCTYQLFAWPSEKSA